MSVGSVNWWAVLVCFVLIMLSGLVWYNRRTFFNPWWQAIGKPESENPSSAPGAWILTLVSSLVQVIFLAVVVPALGGNSLISGAGVGFVLWLGLLAPAILINRLFASQPKAWVIEASNHLINLVVLGAILGAWH
jgi:hypothetical protein